MKIKKIICSIIVFVLSCGMVINTNALSKSSNTYYQEKGQFNINNSTSRTANNELELFLEDNPEIKSEVESNRDKGLELEALSYTRIYLKEVSDSNGVHFEPVSVEEMRSTRAQSTSYNNLTLSLQLYKDSWNPGYASVNEQAVWSGAPGSSGPNNANDDFMALTVAQNYSITSHGMYGVMTGQAMKDRSGNGVSYRFRENSGSQTLTTNNTYSNYSGQRLFVGLYVHTWNTTNVSFGFTATGPTVSISGSSDNWQIGVDLVGNYD